VSTPAGLTQAQVLQSRREHGDNALPTPKKLSFWQRYGESFSDPIVRILLAALGVNALLMLRGSSVFETVGIAFSIVLSTLVSTLSEYSSEAAFEQLQAQSAALQARAVRDNTLVTLPAEELVVGDIVYLSAGDYIPADGLLIRGHIDADQSPLTGESKECPKHPSPAPFTGSINDRGSVFYGSLVTDGEGVMKVCAVGGQTQLGRTAVSLGDIDEDSPLKEKLETLAIKVSRIGYAAAALVIMSDLFHSVVMDNGYDPTLIAATLQNLPLMLSHLLHALTLGVTLVVVAVPEGLPMMITVVLSRNMVKMQRDNVMVRRLVGLETAGGMSLLFTDKTGTLTTGKTAVQCIIDSSGTTYKSIAALKADPPLYDSICRAFLHSASRTGGNSTDRALFDFAKSERDKYRGVYVADRKGFDSQNKFSWVKLGQEYYIKGAPEILLSSCKEALSGKFERDVLTGLLSEHTRCGERVLAVCRCRQAPSGSAFPPLSFVALVCLSDDLRRGVPKAVKKMQKSGVQVVMVTGDALPTACYFAKKCGILHGADTYPQVVEAAKLRAMSDTQLQAILPGVRVIARAVPEDKLRLVKIGKLLGRCVGMTGDGLNDAPALKAADVGFCMGSGTGVSRQAGDIILLDDNFVSITKAALYGRTIYKSIQKFITFQLCLNMAAAGVSMIGPFLGVEAPITVVQMLWINLLMDTFAGLAFAGEPPLERYLDEPPIDRFAPVLSSDMLRHVLVRGGILLGFCLAFLGSPVFYSAYGQNSGSHLGAFFALFVCCGILLAFQMRNDGINPLANIGRNPAFVLIMGGALLVQCALSLWGGTLFRSGSLQLGDLYKVALLSAFLLPTDIMAKIVLRVTKSTLK